MAQSPLTERLAKLSKRDLITEIETLAEVDSRLQGVDTSRNHADILADVTARLSEGDPPKVADPAEDKLAAFDRLTTERPDAVVIPVRQAIVRLQKAGLGTFEMSALPDLEMKYVTELSEMTRQWKEPAENKVEEGRRVGTTRLADVPTWARSAVYDMVEAGDLRVYIDDAAAQEQAGKYTKAPMIDLLDTVTGTVDMKVVYGKTTGMAGAHRPITVEATGTFTEIEQEVAWNVLNSRVGSQPPLPANPDEVSTDPGTLTRAEVEHVRDRIKDAIERPDRYTEKKLPPTASGRPVFRERIFFNQLLSCEYGGFTPQRSVNANKNGGTRRQILLLIRKIAADYGFEVVGDYVVKAHVPELGAGSALGVALGVMPVQPMSDNAQREVRAPYKTFDY